MQIYTILTRVASHFSSEISSIVHLFLRNNRKNYLGSWIERRFSSFLTIKSHYRYIKCGIVSDISCIHPLSIILKSDSLFELFSHNDKKVNFPRNNERGIKKQGSKRIIVGPYLSNAIAQRYESDISLPRATLAITFESCIPFQARKHNTPDLGCHVLRCNDSWEQLLR